MYIDLRLSSKPSAKHPIEPLKIKKAVFEITPEDNDKAVMLANAICLEDLTLRDERAVLVGSVLRPFAWPLANLNLASYSTLARLFYRIEISLPTSTRGPIRLSDPYHGLFRDDLLSQLVKLEKLEVTVWINGATTQTLDPESFGTGWAAFANAIVLPVSSHVTVRGFPTLKSIRFLLGMKGAFTMQEGQQLQALVKQNLIGQHFRILTKHGWRGKPVQSLTGEPGSVFTTLQLKHR